MRIEANDLKSTTSEKLSSAGMGRANSTLKANTSSNFFKKRISSVLEDSGPRSIGINVKQFLKYYI